MELDQPQRRIRNRDHSIRPRVLSGPGGSKFLPAFLPFQARIARVGLVNALSQVVLKTASPGVPDFYQGTELWDLNLVDPDNRRPIDFEHRRQALAEAQAVAALPCASRREAITRLLKSIVRRHDQDVRDDGRPGTSEERRGTLSPRRLRAARRRGSVPGQVVALARVTGERTLIVVVPRLTSKLMDGVPGLPLGDRWKTSRVVIPHHLGVRALRDVFTGAEVRPEGGPNGSWLFVGQVLHTLPL